MAPLMPTPEVVVREEIATRRLYVLNVKSQNLRVPLTQIKNLIVADHVRNFDSGGSLFGGWSPLSPETKSSGTPLVKSGFLRDQLRRKSGPGKRVTKYGVQVGVGYEAESESFYARFHQAGATDGRRGDLPKREVVGITDQTRERGVEMIRQWIVSGDGR